MCQELDKIMPETKTITLTPCSEPSERIGEEKKPEADCREEVDSLVFELQNLVAYPIHFSCSSPFPSVSNLCFCLFYLRGIAL